MACTNAHMQKHLLVYLAGIREVGIFRLPGQASRIQALKDLYDSGAQEDFSSTEDVHSVASLFKLYLRELPEPVVPFAFYESFREVLKGARHVYYLQEYHPIFFLRPFFSGQWIRWK